MAGLLNNPFLLLLLVGLALCGVVALAGWARRAIRAIKRLRGQPPLISLLVVVRNQEMIIEGILRTVYCLCRDKSDFEVVVVDSGSADQTPAILERLARSYQWLRVICSEPRPNAESVQSPLDLGLFLCRSRVVVLLDLQHGVEVRPLVHTLQKVLGNGGLCTRRQRTPH